MKRIKKRIKKKISAVITVWLSGIVITILAGSLVPAYFFMSDHVENQTWKLVRGAVEDVSTATNDMVELSLSIYAEKYSEVVGDTADCSNPEEVSEILEASLSDEGLEVSVVNRKGIVVASSNRKLIGLDLNKDEHLRSFLSVLDSEDQIYTEDLQVYEAAGSGAMKYMSRRMDDKSGLLLFGMGSKLYNETVYMQTSADAVYRRIGQDGYILVFFNGKVISGYEYKHVGDTAESIGLNIDPKIEYEFHEIEAKVYGIESYIEVNTVSGFNIVGVYPISASKRNLFLVMFLFMMVEFIVFTILFATLLILIRRKIVKNVVRMNDGLTGITEGDLDRRIEIHDTYEFDSLSTGINTTVDRLKGYIQEAEARIDKDLRVAAAIQSSALPKAFPKRDEFELFAGMRAAKEVGGDFYDYFRIDDKTLGFLVADVSGKSIPGAMFMMRAKTAIKDLAVQGLSPAEVLTAANKSLCEGNEAEMFVTAWLGFLDFTTGEVRFANAGHNKPVLLRDGKAEYIEQSVDFVLAEFDFIEYEEQTLRLKEGDILYLYTDGVTEAENSEHGQYGEERLKEVLSFGDRYPEPSSENGLTWAVCHEVGEDMIRFIDGAEQFDDVTMLCVRYLGASQK